MVAADLVYGESAVIDPTEKDIGRMVIYQGGHPDDKDEGVITSFNDKYVFVRYTAMSTSQATARCDLRWTTP